MSDEHKIVVTPLDTQSTSYRFEFYSPQSDTLLAREDIDTGNSKAMQEAAGQLITLVPSLGPSGEAVSKLYQAVKQAEAAIQNQSKSNSKHTQGQLVVPLQEINAAELQKQGSPLGLPSIPLLGKSGFIILGWSHIVASYPKTGKTELISRFCFDCRNQGLTVLYITEEPQSIWQARLSLRPSGWEHMNIVFGLGASPPDLLDRIKSGSEDVVVLDTMRNLLGIEEENNNSEVARRIIPYVTTAREAGKTLVLIHHARKGGGQHGEGISGAHAFLGVVDIALEIHRDKNNPSRRLLRGWGRIAAVPELVYEMTDDNNLIALGDPSTVSKANVETNVMAVLTEDWVKTADIRDLLDEPKPSAEQVRKVLVDLASIGVVERDPPIEQKKATGKGHKWRLHTDQNSHDTDTPDLPSNGASPNVGGQVDKLASSGEPHLLPMNGTVGGEVGESIKPFGIEDESPFD